MEPRHFTLGPVNCMRKLLGFLVSFLAVGLLAADNPVLRTSLTTNQTALHAGANTTFTVGGDNSITINSAAGGSGAQLNGTNVWTGTNIFSGVFGFGALPTFDTLIGIDNSSNIINIQLNSNQLNKQSTGLGGTKLISIIPGVLLTNPVVNSGTISGDGSGLTNITGVVPGFGLYANANGLQSTFVFSQPTLTQYRIANAKVMTGATNMDVGFYGDSVTWYGAGGILSISNTAYLNTMQSNITAYLYQEIPNARLGWMGSHIFDNHSGFLDVHYFDTNLVVPSNWGTFNADGIGGSLMVSANGTTNAISFTSGRTISGCRVYVYCATGGANGNANVILDGSTTLATIPCSSLSDVMYITNVNFTSGMHTVFVQPTNNASTGVYLVGMVPYETNSVNLINCGWESATTGNWLESVQKYGPLQMGTNLAPRLVVLNLGINDLIQNQMASFSNNLYMLVTNYQGKAKSSVVLCVGSASNSGRDFTQLSADIYGVGALLGCPVIDFNKQLTNGYPQEFFTLDSVHPNASGYADESRALMSVFSPTIYQTTSSGGGSGTVTSVGLSVPSQFSISGSPVTGSGTLVLSYANAGSVPITNGQSGVTVLGGVAIGVTNGPSIWYFSGDSAMILSGGTGGIEFNNQGNSGYMGRFDNGGIGGGVGRLITQGITLGSGGGGDLSYGIFTNSQLLGMTGGTNGFVWNGVDGITNLMFLTNNGNLTIARGSISVSNGLSALSNLVSSGWVRVSGNQTNLGSLTVTGSEMITNGTTTDPVDITGTVNNYFEVFLQNLSNGNQASADLVLANDLSSNTDTNHILDIFINSSGYTATIYGTNNDAGMAAGLFTTNLYVIDQATNGHVRIAVGGQYPTNTVADFTTNGVTITNNIAWTGVATGNGSGITALNASSLSSGTVPSAQLPLATSGAFGAVKVDGTTITAAAGVISAVGGASSFNTNQGTAFSITFAPATGVSNSIIATNGSILVQSVTNQPAIALSNLVVNGASAASMFDLRGAWNTSATPSPAVYWNITNTASAGTGNLFEIDGGASGATPELRVNKAGTLTMAAGVSAGTTLTAGGDTTITSGNVIVATAGKGLQIKGGTNAKIGQATLASGTVTVANSSVTANSFIIPWYVTPTGTIGSLSSPTNSITAGTSFIINSVTGAAIIQTLDNSVIGYMIVEKN